MAELGEVPFRRYYGSVDSTPLFVVLAGAYLQRTDDARGVEAALAPYRSGAELDRRLRATATAMDSSNMAARAMMGLLNQGWKDSHDSVFHADGTLAQGPIALVEVQGYVYAAKRAASTIALRLDNHDRALKLEYEAEQLQKHFDAEFLGRGAWYLRPGARWAKNGPAASLPSNAGHTLFSGIALASRAPANRSQSHRP